MTHSLIGLTLNYRDVPRTQRCVKSLLAEGVEQVLVWDNSEDNGTSAAALRQAFAHTQKVLIHESPTNLGFATGVNRALTLITEQTPNAWVLLINNDAVLLPGALVALRQALETHPHAVLAYPTIDHGGRLIGTAYYHRVLGLITTRPLPGSIPYASGCCQLIAPARYPGLLYDEDFFMYGEDTELGWRLGPERMVHVPQLLVDHEGSASSGMATDFYETRMAECHWRLTKKLAKNRIDLALLYLGRLLTLPLRALIRTLRYRSPIPLKALAKGWRLAHGQAIHAPFAAEATRSKSLSHMGTMRSGE
ncbi:MAG: glycosyltransferase family 2 protein [Methylohalobius sp.]|nr:glycosyltransferase family 2 protein [Methylohalobius sp.]